MHNLFISTGIWDPRKRGVDGSDLENPRVLANTVLQDIDNPDPEFTLSVMQWAQFVDHDLAHVPFYDRELSSVTLQMTVIRVNEIKLSLSSHGSQLY